jgi:iron complex transport system permease protein
VLSLVNNRLIKPTALPLLVAIIVAVATIAVALTIGRYALSFTAISQVLWAAISGQAPPDITAATVLFELRAPRVFAAFIVGAALAAAGAAYQNLFRNPLVSPDILGVSAGASLGAVLAILLAWPLAALQGAAFVGGVAAVVVIVGVGYLLDQRNTMRLAYDRTLTLVLAGVVLGALFSAGVTLIKSMADPDNKLPAITYWLMGSFSAVGVMELKFALPPMVAGLTTLWLLRWRINLLSLTDDDAKALSANLSALRLWVIAAATLLTAASVAISGAIGWIGLVVPHAVRLLVGAEFSRLLPLAMLLGGAFMVAMDTIARSIAATEIAPGIFTALIGAPMFIYLLASNHQSARGRR